MENELIKYYSLSGVTAESATDRNGIVYAKGESVMIREHLYNERYSVKMWMRVVGQELEICEIYLCDHCESGFMLHVMHKESKSKFKCLMDTNWFKKF